MFASQNPFAPLAKKRTMQTVDTKKLKIERTPYQARERASGSKYEALFDKLQAGECIVAPVGTAGSLRNALVKYHSARGYSAVVRTLTKCADGNSRVWLMRIDPIAKRKAA